MKDPVNNRAIAENEDRGDEYLWNRTGPIDPEVARLEQMLAPLRFQGAPSGPGLHLAGPERRRSFPLRAAAMVALAIGGVWIAAIALQQRSIPGRNPGRIPGVTWDVAVLRGAPHINASQVSGAGHLAIGQWLETDSVSQAQVAVASVGNVTVEPDSRVRLVQSGETEHRLELQRGRIQAFITAPPRLFFVDTPGATAVDLGCRYELAVDKDGSGMLQVTLGWVSLERDGRESIVPSGAACRTQKGIGLGTPYYLDASQRFQRELERLDFGDHSDDALQAVLEESRSRDILTLWHLLARAPASTHQRIFDRLAELAPLPQDIDRQEALAGNREALIKWRDTMIWSPLPPISRVH